MFTAELTSPLEAALIGWIGGWSCASFSPFFGAIGAISILSAKGLYSFWRAKSKTRDLKSKSSAYLLVSVLG